MREIKAAKNVEVRRLNKNTATARSTHHKSRKTQCQLPRKFCCVYSNARRQWPENRNSSNEHDHQPYYPGTICAKEHCELHQTPYKQGYTPDEANSPRVK